MRIHDDLDTVSDAVDEVNILKGKVWDESSQFDAAKDKTQFRQYEAACDRVKNFYMEQHEKQTVEFNIKMRANMRKSVRARMGIWEAMEKLNTLVDNSDPDTALSQIERLMQTAEAIRRDGKPDWSHWTRVTGLVHDLGKLLHLFVSEEIGRCWHTFVVDCAFSEKIVQPDSFVGNPESQDAVYSTEYGIYNPNCGLENVMLSWGHDEYIYHILKNQSSLPEEGFAMIRYHSFYPWHCEGAYTHITNASDEKVRSCTRAFNPYNLYSKSDEAVDPAALKPYYEGLIKKYFKTRPNYEVLDGKLNVRMYPIPSASLGDPPWLSQSR
ncbi:myo-inositol oxygenase [Mycena galericulata]|nr:myo-inositol oxygenase [Mycena galericulata]